MNDVKNAAPTLLPLGAMMMASLLGSGAALAETEKTLNTVNVTATSEAPEGYLATKTRVGKVAQDPHDIPQAITTVSRTLMEEQEANSLREALRNVSGLSFNAAEGGRSGDNMMLRGFYTFGDMYLDGIRDTAQYNRETFNTEQVDVLRGAAAMLFGRGQAGGVINQVSKAPQLYSVNKAEIGVGSNEYREVKADLNQRIGETSAIRINLMNRDEGSPRKNPVTGATPEIHRAGIAPSVAFGLGTNNEVTLSHLYLESQDRPDYGIPFGTDNRPNADFAKSKAYWGLSSGFDDSQTNISTLNYLHKFSADTQWRTVARVAKYQRAYWASAPGTASNFISGGNAKTRDFTTDNVVVQSDFNTAFKLLGMRHELVTGVEFLHESSQRWTLKNLGTTIPFYQRGQYTTTQPNTYEGDTFSAYVQDTVEFLPNWRLTAGVRRDDMRSDYATVSGSGAGTSVTRFSGNFAENSYRTGLSWQPLPTHHYYLGWSDSFSPTADLYQLSGSQYPAERSKVSEIGGKWLFMDGALAFRTALYHATKDWERNTDLESAASILTKRRESNGIELELAGHVTDEWEIFGGLSVIDAKILEASPFAPNDSTVGQRPRNTPHTTANLWTTYLLGNGFKIGGGFEYKSERNGFSPTSAYNPKTVPSYIRWDAMAQWRQPGYSIKLNVQNLFNKLYYDALYDNGGFTVPGQARRYILSTEFKF